MGKPGRAWVSAWVGAWVVHGGGDVVLGGEGGGAINKLYLFCYEKTDLATITNCSENN